MKRDLFHHQTAHHVLSRLLDPTTVSIQQLESRCLGMGSALVQDLRLATPHHGDDVVKRENASVTVPLACKKLDALAHRNATSRSCRLIQQSSATK